MRDPVEGTTLRGGPARPHGQPRLGVSTAADGRQRGLALRVSPALAALRRAACSSLVGSGSASAAALLAASGKACGALDPATVRD
jgi:hypothetical protein